MCICDVQNYVNMIDTIYKYCQVAEIKLRKKTLKLTKVMTMMLPNLPMGWNSRCVYYQKNFGVYLLSFEEIRAVEYH